MKRISRQPVALAAAALGGATRAHGEGASGRAGRILLRLEAALEDSTTARDFAALMPCH